MKTIQQLAAEMAAQFETRTHNNGDTFQCLKDGHPDWMHDVCRKAHGDMLPDDYRYDMIATACEAISESYDTQIEDRDFGQAIDGCVSVYNHEQLRWLASNLNRAGYCDKAAVQFGNDSPDIMKMIAGGWYYEADEVFSLVIDALTEEVENQNA